MKDERLKTKDIALLTMFISELDDEYSYLRKKLINFITEEHEHGSKILIKKAIEDKKITQEEIDDLKKKHKINNIELGEMFKIFYDEGINIPEGEDDLDEEGREKKVKMLTMKGSSIWKLRHFIKERFGAEVVDHEGAEELLEMMERQNKENMDKSKDIYDYIG